MKTTSANTDLELALLVDQITALLEQGKRDDVDALFKSYPAHADRLARILPAIEALATLDSQTQDANEIHPAKSLGDFRIVREIGRGGMGVVYEAEQRSLGRRIALKVLPLAATLSAQQLERFKNEARLAASLRHPHIVGVHSVGVERGVHYYAMDLVEGCSLAQAIQEMRSSESEMPSEESALRIPNSEFDTAVAALTTVRTNSAQEYFRQAAKIIADAAEALDYAHNQGIVHRDIKPGNLLLDADGRVHLADFGLARLEADAGVTLTGDLLGTLRYMSPEQAAGKPGLVDYRTDIHSLGATLYELLAMRPAFGEGDRAQLLRRIVEETPTPLWQLDAKVPLDLETIVAKAMEKEPADRYATAGGLAADLRAFLDHRAIAAKPPSLRQRVVKWSRRHAGAVSAIAISVLLASLVSTWLIAKHVSQQQAVAASVASCLQRVGEAFAAEDSELAQGILAEASTQAALLARADSPLQQRIEVLNRELKRYQEFADHYRRARSGRYRESEFATKALDLYDVAAEEPWRDALHDADLPSQFIDALTENVYELLVLLAWHTSDDFRYAKNPAAKLQAIERAESWLDKAADLRAPAKGYYWVRALCSQRRGDLAEGTERARHDAEALRLRGLAEQAPLQTAADLFIVARDRTYGCADGSEREPFRNPFADVDELLAAFREVLRVEPDYYPALFFTSFHLAEAQRHEAALQGWNGCLVCRPDDWIAQINRTLALSRLERYEESVKELRRCREQALTYLDARRGSDRRRWVYARLNYQSAWVLHRAGKEAEARALLLDAQEVLDGEMAVRPDEFIAEWVQKVADLLTDVEQGATPRDAAAPTATAPESVTLENDADAPVPADTPPGGQPLVD